MITGTCLCGGVKIKVVGEIPPMDACHCSYCRKSSGHFGVGTDLPRENVQIFGEENVRWYQSSDWARRGFCKTCGANLFFDPLNKEKVPWIGVSMGIFDGPTNTRIKEHIFVGKKGDYYEIKDGLPQYNTYPGDPGQS